MRELATQFLSACEKTKSDGPTYGRASLDGQFAHARLATFRKAALIMIKPSRFTTLPTSLSGDEVRSRLGVANSFRSLALLAPWVSVGRSKRQQGSNPLCTGDKSSGQLILCTHLYEPVVQVFLTG